MNSFRNATVLLLSGGLILGACGSTDDSGDGPSSELSPDARRAFGTAVDHKQPFRMDYAIMIETNGAGVSMTIGGDEPVGYLEVDADGETYQYLDVAPMMEQSGVPVPDDTTMEVWTKGDTEVLNVGAGMSELTSLAATQGDNAAAEAMAELFAPGMFTVDRSEVEAETGDTNARMPQNTGLSDPSELLDSLADAYSDADPGDGDDNDAGADGGTRSFTTTLGDLYPDGDSFDFGEEELVGGQGSIDAATMQNLNDELTNTEVDVTLAVDDEGRVTEAVMSMELDGYMQSVADVMLESFPEEQRPAAEAAMAQMAEMSISQTQSLSFDYNADVDVEFPTDVTDDRTDLMIEWVESVQAVSDELQDQSATTSADGA